MERPTLNIELQRKLHPTKIFRVFKFWEANVVSVGESENRLLSSNGKGVGQATNSTS